MRENDDARASTNALLNDLNESRLTASGSERLPDPPPIDRGDVDRNMDQDAEPARIVAGPEGTPHHPPRGLTPPRGPSLLPGGTRFRLGGKVGTDDGLTPGRSSRPCGIGLSGSSGAP